MRHWWQTKVLKRPWVYDRYGRPVYFKTFSESGASILGRFEDYDYYNYTFTWWDLGACFGIKKDDLLAKLGCDEKALEEAGMTISEWWASRNG